MWWKVLARSGGRRGILAGLLTALLAGQLALSALPAPAPSHESQCSHDSCPLRRPAKSSSKPSCHGEGSHHGTQTVEKAAVPVGSSCSLSASCGCGHPHSPSAPHWETRAVLALVAEGWRPAPAGFVTRRTGIDPSVPLLAPEPPPPRS